MCAPASRNSPTRWTIATPRCFSSRTNTPLWLREALAGVSRSGAGDSRRRAIASRRTRTAPLDDMPLATLAARRRSAADVHLGQHRPAEGGDTFPPNRARPRKQLDLFPPAHLGRSLAAGASAVSHQRGVRDPDADAAQRRLGGGAASLQRQPVLGLAGRISLHLVGRGADDHLAAPGLEGSPRG